MDTQKLEQTGTDSKKSNGLGEELKEATLEILKASKYKKILKAHNISDKDFKLTVSIKNQEIVNIADTTTSTNTVQSTCLICGFDDTGAYICIEYPNC